GLAIAGIDITRPIVGGDIVHAQLFDGVQVAEFDLSFDSYANISVKKGVPVQLVINADADKLTGCNNEIVIDEWNIDKKLSPGRNVIEFTPDEAGTFTYSCWMHMITNTIQVTD
ncbi:MAG: cupredoxin domain-containing protein, partial [Eggerthellaceae bacterium]|nr:cupredoxin domain-containing protein [Eggerthellaceae bacterium]